MNGHTPVVIGIDGGGTHSFAVAVDSAGRTLATAMAGSLNFLSAGWPTARRNLKTLVGALEQRLPPRLQPGKIVVGCAALFSDATNAEKGKLCRGILPLRRTRVVSDCQTACFGATLGRPGVAVIAGTGSIVLAVNETGQLTRVGGWGHLLGDAGSAYWIAVESVKAAIAAEEGLGPSTALGPVIGRWFDTKRLAGIVSFIYGPRFRKEAFAGLAGYLARKVGRRDAVFRRICQQAGQELAAQARAAVKLARLRSRPLSVCLVGSVLTNNALVRDSLVAALKRTGAARFAKPVLSPSQAAAAMALSDAGVELTADVVGNLAKSDLGTNLNHPRASDKAGKSARSHARCALPSDECLREILRGRVRTVGEGVRDTTRGD